MSASICSICEADWQPSCAEHPVAPRREPVRRSADYDAGYHAGITRGRRLRDAAARNPAIAARYGVQS